MNITWFVAFDVDVMNDLVQVGAVAVVQQKKSSMGLQNDTAYLAHATEDGFLPALLFGLWQKVKGYDGWIGYYKSGMVLHYCDTRPVLWIQVENI